MKTRYAKPFESVQVEIPYETGMSPYSGMVDLCEAKGILVKDGNRLKYVSIDGTEIKMYRKEWDRNEEGGLDKIMLEFNQTIANKNLKPTIDQDTGEILENVD
jgi:hypothetical protein